MDLLHFVILLLEVVFVTDQTIMLFRDSRDKDDDLLNNPLGFFVTTPKSMLLKRDRLYFSGVGGFQGSIPFCWNHCS